MVIASPASGRDGCERGRDLLMQEDLPCKGLYTMRYCRFSTGIKKTTGSTRTDILSGKTGDNRLQKNAVVFEYKVPIQLRTIFYDDIFEIIS